MWGIAAALVSAVCVTAKDVVSKSVAGRVDGTVSALASFLYALPWYLVVLLILWLLGLESFAVTPEFFIWIGLRALSDSVAEQCKMYALSSADLSLVTSFLSLSPLFLLLTSPLITGDPLTGAGILAVVLVVAGTLLLVYRPGTTLSGADRRGIMFGVAASVFFSINTCFDRLAVQTASPTLSGFAVTLLAGLVLLPQAMRRTAWLRQLRSHARAFTLRGGFELGFMVTKLYALQFLPAPQVAALQRISILLNVASGRVIFKDRDFRRRFLAALLMVAGILVIVFER